MKIYLVLEHPRKFISAHKSYDDLLKYYHKYGIVYERDLKCFIYDGWRAGGWNKDNELEDWYIEEENLK